MHRFFAERTGPDTAVLSKEESAHALRVLRMEAGDACQAILEGELYAAQVKEADDPVTLALGDQLPTTEPSVRITLYQGLPKADKMELIVQKSVELGACAVVPVAMSRCVVQLDAKDGRKKQERWQKIAREACKQSGRCEMMQVTEPISFKQLLTRLSEHEAAIVPWEDAQGYSLARFHQEHPDVTDLAIVIGPEGGISPEEKARLDEIGAQSVTLGKRILRTETAGLCALAALWTALGEM